MDRHNKLTLLSMVLMTVPLLGATSHHPHVPSSEQIVVAANGPTSLSTSIGGTVVSALIVSRVQTEASSESSSVSACTHSRIPCSLIRQLRLRVGRNEIFLPASVVLRLADVNRASLSRNGAAKFELLLECGDSSEAYDAHVIFDDKRVTEIDIVGSESGMLAEKTTYADLSHSFDD